MKNKFKSLLATALLVIGLGGCGSKTSSSSEPVNQSSTNSQTGVIGENNYYNEENFIRPENSVTTTKLVTYDGPEYLNESEKIDVKVNDKDLFVYETRVNHGRKFSWDLPTETAPIVTFDFEGKVHIEIDVKEGEVSSAQVSPLVYGIKPTIKGNKISFDLEYPDNYTVEYNGDYKTAIHIFANEIEKDPITKEEADKDDSIIYIGPGVYKADAIPVKDDTTIYLAGGAYVYGQVRAEGLKNITIRGRGIFSGEIYNRRSESEYLIPIEMRSSENITIEDIAFLDPAGWTIALYKSKNITLNNIKIITARQNGDGISVQSCENVTVTGGFVRSWDDSLVVKNVDRGTTKNVTFDDVTVWTDLAQSMEVGYETNGPTMDDITFKNITVVHNFHKAVISLHNCDDAVIKNVKYQNITVEDAQMLGDDRNDGENDFLIDFTIAYNIDWTHANTRGSVDGVTIENVKVYKMLDSIVCRMIGEATTSMIKNVSINGVEIEGKQVTKEELNILTNDYTENVTVNKMDKVLGASIKLPYLNQVSDNNIDYSNVTNITQEGMLVPEFARAKGDLPYIGQAASINMEATARHGAGTKTSTPADDGSGDFLANDSSANYAVDNNPETYYRHGSWKGEDNEFASLTLEFDTLKTVGVIRILGNPDNEFYYTYELQVWGRTLKNDGVTINDNYKRIVSLKSYEMTPGSNNCIDINITTQQYKGLQLRLYKSDSVSAPEYYDISEIEFYPPSLSFNKAIVDSTAHNDVYNVEKLVDGDATGTSYYESSELPAYIVIDLGQVYSVSTFVMCLPPSLKWDARTQNIEILGSDSTLDYDKSKTSFTTLVEATDYLFDPSTGNINVVKLSENKDIRFVKLVITSNDIKGGYNAQLSEFSVYEG